jgi:peptidyl-prolyl cis-trans isomerase C
MQVSNDPKPALLKRWVREPLVHFVLIGAVLFAVYSALHSKGAASTDSKKIVLTANDVNQISLMWQAQGRPAPTADQIQSLLDNKIREEVLYREALALGLDKDDTIVKRRMAQKMDFLTEDLSDLRQPSREELGTWFAKNTDRFMLPGRISFRHLYFSFDKHGPQTATAAADSLKKISGKPSDASEAATLADPFMFQDYYGDRSFDAIAKNFGPGFAKALFQLKPGSWQGPIESGYGWHLVFIDSLTPARVPAFEEVEADVKTAWVGEQRAEFKRNAFEAMRSRYEIVVPKAPANPSDVAVTFPDLKGGF